MRRLAWAALILLAVVLATLLWTGRASAEEGVATWYGGELFQGQLTASGEPYDQDDPTTAASTSYPLGTWLRVTNRETGQSIVVRVNDTGLFWRPHLLDLSWAAFGKLADHSQGVIPVDVEPVAEPVLAARGGEREEPEPIYPPGVRVTHTQAL